MIKQIKTKERDAIIRSLRSGVVPRVGLQHIQVGRSNELKSFIGDVENIAEGGTSFRFVIGEYGSGKTFFVSLVRSIAMEKGLVTVKADLSPTKRLHGSNGEAHKLLSELISSLSTRTKPDGNALTNILDKFVNNARQEAMTNGTTVSNVIYQKLGGLRDFPGGYSFAKVVDVYWKAYENAEDQLKDCALRWLRCEYRTKTEAIRDLGVRELLSDSSLFNALILCSILVKQAGYGGLLVCMDEMVNLYKIPNSVSRKANYEELLSILNNTLQGSLSSVGFIMCGTPEFLTDGLRGLYSYEALKSRLAENGFSDKLGLVDYNSTVIRLANLTPEELLILLKNLRNVFASGDESKYLVSDEALVVYMEYCANKIGESYFRTPRNTIKGFLDLLSILEQYPDKDWTDCIGNIEVLPDVEPTEIEDIVSMPKASTDSSTDELFASFKL